MLNINPSRMRSPNRVPTQSDKQPSAQSKTYLAPIGGLVTNTPLAASNVQTAVVMENFWPTTTGIEPRGGAKLRCTIAGAVKALFQYRAGSARTYFAADTGNIYQFDDATPDATALTPVVTGQTGADYSVLEMETDGGSFLTAVNGADNAQIYDGTSWQQVTDVSAPFAITGIATDKLSHVWAYRNRQFFIEYGTMNAWYLAVNSVAGTATKLPLAGVFNRGGRLLFGATWSSDSGAGMDDRCVFATDQGEFAVFTGGNPGDANDWSLNGVYDIGEPLGKNGTMQIGGDLVVMTKAGLIPLSAAMQKDSSELKLAALSRDISPTWQSEIALAGSASNWRIAKWASRNAAYICPPQNGGDDGYCYAVNLETGKWTKFTGWRIGAMAVLGDFPHYGDPAGNIYQCETGGTDNGQLFECRACLAFDDLGAPGNLKTVHSVRGLWKHRVPIKPKHSVAVNYVPAFPTSPVAVLDTASVPGAWDYSAWEVTEWVGSLAGASYLQKWQSVSGHGRAIALQVQLVSANSYKLDCELVSLDLVHTTGALLA